MVWFQCEDCGENLKKPKLANHFRTCSAYKLSCIDCGEMFNQESVQRHTQCITEAEKYGPKGQGGIVTHNGQTKPDKPKKNSDVDINVGLSTRPPWFCSLCNTQTTSKQTLLLHADGKKHRAKARAFHAAPKQSNQTEPTLDVELVGTGQKVESVEANCSNNKVQEGDLHNESEVPIPGCEKEKHERKRKVEANEDGLSQRSEKKNGCDSTNGEVVQAEQPEESHRKSKKKKAGDQLLNCADQADKQGLVMESPLVKIKWKKLIASTLKSSDGVMKTKKLQKLVVEALKESGVAKNEEELRDKLMHKINSSSRFTMEGKHIRLVPKTDES